MLITDEESEFLEAYNKFTDKELMEVSQKNLEKRIYKKRSTMTSFMNNSKWRLLFEAIANEDIDIVISQMSSLDPDENQSLYMIELEICDYDRRYTRDGCGATERLRDIEYILITVSSFEDMKILKNVIGHLDFLCEYEFIDAKTIKIFGYR